jgi:hypothetical protein
MAGCALPGTSLSAIVESAGRTPQVRRMDVRRGDLLLVKTRNSLYTITMRSRKACTVTGGWFDKRGKSPTETTVCGCTWGGSVIKVDILAAVGLCIEFGNRLITTEARKIVLLRKEALN